MAAAFTVEGFTVAASTATGCAPGWDAQRMAGGVNGVQSDYRGGRFGTTNRLGPAPGTGWGRRLRLGLGVGWDWAMRTTGVTIRPMMGITAIASLTR